MWGLDINFTVALAGIRGEDLLLHSALFALGGHRPELLIEKRTKHKELAQIDIAPLIREMTLTEQDGSILADAVVAAQNPGLNPAYLAQAIERELPALKPDFVRVRRTEIYDTEGNVFR